MYKKLNLVFALLLVAYIPFREFVASLLLDRFGFSAPFSFWAAHWYEPFLIIFSLINLFLYFKRSRKPKAWLCLVMILLVFGLVSVVALAPTHSIGLQGYRFTLLFLFSLLLIVEKDETVVKIMTVYLSVALIIAVWAIVERLLPLSYWHKAIGLAPDFGFGRHFVGSVPRSTSIFLGPNQLGSYLVPAALVFAMRYAAEEKYRIRNLTFMGITILAISFSYSRAAMLGSAVGLILLLLFYSKIWRQRLVLLLVAFFATLMPMYIALQQGNTTDAIITHGESQTGHIDAKNATLLELINRSENNPEQLIIGAGLGTAGPIVIKYGNGLVSESWYLQVLLELGIVGLLLWLVIVSQLVIRVGKSNSALALGLIGVSVTALFLHTFADSPALSYTLFLLIGAQIWSVEKKIGHGGQK